MSIVDQQRASEARLYDDAISGIEVENDQFRPAPAAYDSRIPQTLCKRSRADLAQDVRFSYRDFLDLSTADRTVEIAGDSLGLR
jgi:hypothetical protein